MRSLPHWRRAARHRPRLPEKLRRLAPATGALMVCAGLVGCNVQLHDETPASYQADNGAAMYQLQARITRPFLVAPDSVFVSALVDDHLVRFEPDASLLTWHGLYSVRCRAGFSLQYRAIWSVQSITSRSVQVPARPRTVQLTEPPPPQQVKIETSMGNAKTWSGVVHYQFITAPRTTITTLRIEPLGGSAADAATAAPIKLQSQTPLTVECGAPLDVGLESSALRAAAYLVLETTNPGVPRWRTRVDFAP
jgi:hypothetical protein